MRLLLFQKLRRIHETLCEGTPLHDRSPSNSSWSDGRSQKSWHINSYKSCALDRKSVLTPWWKTILRVNSLMKCILTIVTNFLHGHWCIVGVAEWDRCHVSPSLSAHTPTVMKTFSDEPGDPICVSISGSWLRVHLVWGDYSHGSCCWCCSRLQV